MKRCTLVAVLLAIAIVPGVFAGGTSEKAAQPAASSQPVQEKEHYKFAWIMPDMFNPFWVYMRQGAEKAALEYQKQGIKVDIQQMAPIQTFNVEQQVALIENAIQMKVDGIGLCVIDQESVIPSLNKAAAAGIPTIALSTDIPNSKRLAFSGVPDREWAQKVSEYAVKQEGGKGNYVVLEGIPGNLISEQRLLGFKDTIAKYPDTKLLGVLPANFNRKDGEAAMENFLTKYPKGQIQGVFCANDEIALGAIQAIDAAGRTSDMVVQGIDGNTDAAHEILNGRMLVTLSDRPWDEGYQGVKALVEFKEGKTVPDVLPGNSAVIVDKSNAQDVLNAIADMANYYKP